MSEARAAKRPHAAEVDADGDLELARRRRPAEPAPCTPFAAWHGTLPEDASALAALRCDALSAARGERETQH